MSKLDLSKYEKCTPGPWKVNYAIGDKTIQISGNTNFYPDKDFIWIDNDDCDHKESKANAQLVADAPQLLAELRKARAEIGKLRAALDEALRVIRHTTAESNNETLFMGEGGSNCTSQLMYMVRLTRKDA